MSKPKIRQISKAVWILEPNKEATPNCVLGVAYGPEGKLLKAKIQIDGFEVDCSDLETIDKDGVKKLITKSLSNLANVVNELEIEE